MPAVAGTPEYRDSVVAWYTELQPRGRVIGSRTALSIPPAFAQRGLNGTATLITLLYWWAAHDTTLAAPTQGVTWRTLVDDLAWVLGQPTTLGLPATTPATQGSTRTQSEDGYDPKPSRKRARTVTAPARAATAGKSSNKRRR